MACVVVGAMARGSRSSTPKATSDAAALPCGRQRTTPSGSTLPGSGLEKAQTALAAVVVGIREDDGDRLGPGPALILIAARPQLLLDRRGVADVEDDARDAIDAIGGAGVDAQVPRRQEEGVGEGVVAALDAELQEPGLEAQAEIFFGCSVPSAEVGVEACRAGVGRGRIPAERPKPDRGGVDAAALQKLNRYGALSLSRPFVKWHAGAFKRTGVSARRDAPSIPRNLDRGALIAYGRRERTAFGVCVRVSAFALVASSRMAPRSWHDAGPFSSGLRRQERRHGGLDEIVVQGGEQTLEESHFHPGGVALGDDRVDSDPGYHPRTRRAYAGSSRRTRVGSVMARRPGV